MDYVTLGTIVNTRGLKGELKVKSTTDFPSIRYQKGNSVWLLDPQTEVHQEVQIIHHERKEGMDYLQLRGLHTIEAVERYKGWLVQWPIEQLQVLPEGAYHYHDLLGCEVINEQGFLRGTVIKIDDHGAHPVLRVQHEQTVVLFPFVASFLVEVCIEAKRIVIREIEGMFE